MPFDPIGFKETHPFVPGKEGLRMLARSLRAPMPERFEWDFGTTYEKFGKHKCETVGCAMGLAHEIWPDRFHPIIIFPSRIASIFDMSASEVAELFIPEWVFSGNSALASSRKISPFMVADAIDCYLDTGKIWPEDLRT